MKIALEISNIGQGCFDTLGRAGVYRVATSLTEALINKNVDLFFTCNYRPHTAGAAQRFIKSQYKNAKFISDNSALEQKIFNMMFDMPKLKHKYGLMLYASKFIKAIHKKKFPKFIDIFHSLYFPLPDTISPKKHIRILTIHDIIAIRFPEFCKKVHIKSVRKAVQSINHKYDWVITVSQSTKNDFCEYSHFPEERVFVTPLAASPRLYFKVNDFKRIKTIKDIHNIPDNDYFLSIATLEPRKNIDFALRCFKKIISEPDYSHFNFVLTGNKGWKIQDLYSWVKSDPVLKDKVFFTGYIPDEHLSAIYSGATAFVYPSLYEGFGLPPLEAMQCGTPVITSNTSSLPEVVGDAGILVNPKDEDALCQAMTDLSNNSKLRDNLSTLGLERAQMFSWEKSADDTIRTYQLARENKLR